MIISNLGQIKQITIPEGWQQVNLDQHLPAGSKIPFVEFCPAYQPNAKLRVKSERAPISEWSARKFAQLRQAPPHQLSENEFNSVSEIAHLAANNLFCKPRKIETVDVNGKTILVFEGEFFHEGVVGLFLFMGHLSYIEELSFLAAEPEFSILLPSVRDCIGSIHWNQLSLDQQEQERRIIDESTDESTFDNPESFPEKQLISSILMLEDGSLDVEVIVPPPTSYRQSLHCPKQTKLFDYLISISGLLTPGQLYSGTLARVNSKE